MILDFLVYFKGSGSTLPDIISAPESILPWVDWAGFDLNIFYCLIYIVCSTCTSKKVGAQVGRVNPAYLCFRLFDKELFGTVWVCILSANCNEIII